MNWNNQRKALKFSKISRILKIKSNKLHWNSQWPQQKRMRFRPISISHLTTHSTHLTTISIRTKINQSPQFHNKCWLFLLRLLNNMNLISLQVIKAFLLLTLFNLRNNLPIGSKKLLIMKVKRCKPLHRHLMKSLKETRILDLYYWRLSKLMMNT